MLTNPNDSQDKSVHTDANGNSNVTHIELAGRSTTILVVSCIVTALAITVSYLCLQALWDLDREVRLKEYDIGIVKNELIAPLSGQVQAHKLLIEQLQTQMAVRRECSR